MKKDIDIILEAISELEHLGATSITIPIKYKDPLAVKIESLYNVAYSTLGCKPEETNPRIILENLTIIFS